MGFGDPSGKKTAARQDTNKAAIVLAKQTNTGEDIGEEGRKKKACTYVHTPWRTHTHCSSLTIFPLFFCCVQISIDSWPRNSQYPLGHYKKCIGNVGDREAENEALLLEHNVDDQPFASGVLACVPPLPWNVVESDLKNREDLREWTICSVDPPGCKDIDDALSIREDPTDPNLLEVRDELRTPAQFGPLVHDVCLSGCPIALARWECTLLMSPILSMKTRPSTRKPVCDAHPSTLSNGESTCFPRL